MRANRRVNRRMLAAGISILMLSSSLSGTALADHTGSPAGLVGGFEIDGNAPLDGAGSRDWANVSKVTVDDLVNSGSDDIFKGGSKENDHTGWQFVSQSAPGKDDFDTIWVSSSVSPTGPSAYLWVAFELWNGYSGNGDAHANFEFNQKAPTGDIPNRTDGDLLVVYDFPGGTAPVKIGIREWDSTAGTGGNPGAWVVFTGNIDVLGDINGSAVVGPDGDQSWDCDATTPDAPDGQPDEAINPACIQAERFGEAGVDLWDLITNGDNPTCRSFSSVIVKSRSSGESFTASLKDKAGPAPIDIDLCSTIKVPKVDQDGALLDGATFELWLDHDKDGFEGGDDDELIDTCVSGRDGAGMCEFNGLNQGSYYVRETAPPDGYVLSGTTVHGPIELGFLDEEWATSDGTSGGDPVFVNKRLVYTIAITPDAQNLWPEYPSHTFVVELTSNDDAAPTVGQTLDLALTNNTAGATLSGGDTCVTALVTDPHTSQQVVGCLVTVTATQPGTVTLTAGLSPDNGAAVTWDANDPDGTKSWTTFKVDVTNDGTNLVATDDDAVTHTFYVKVTTSSDGTNFTGVSGLTHSADGDFTVTVGGDTGGLAGDPGTCYATGTNSDGVCTVNVTSTATGETTVTAVYRGTEDGQVVTYGPDGPATKTWIDYQIEIGPAKATNLAGTTHDIEVTVEKDSGDGNGMQPASGEGVNLTLTGVGTFVDSGTTSTTCTTGDDGTCTVQITSPDAGESTVEASITRDVHVGVSDSDTRTFTTDPDADKLWVAYDLSITGSGENPIYPPYGPNDQLPTHPFEVTLTVDDGSGPDPVEGEVVQLTLSGVGNFVGSDQSTTCTTDVNGKCTVLIESAFAGVAIVTANYTATDEANNSQPLDPVSATKTWVDLDISVGDDGVNRAGDPHTFMVIVSEDRGSGLTPLSGVSVDLDWDGDGTITAIAPSGTIDTDGKGGTCTTGAVTVDDVQLIGCTVTVSSTTAGSGKLTATYETTIGTHEGVVADGDDTATKVWVDYELDVTPRDVTNLLPENDTHIFTVTLTSSDGTDAPTAGQTLDLTLTSTVAKIVAVNGSDVTPTTSTTCVTDGDGQCTVLVETSGPGDATLSASYDPAVGGATVTSSPDNDGHKTWTTFRVRVEPLEAENLVDTEHVFQVWVEDTVDGQNWITVEGATAPDGGLTINVEGVGEFANEPGTCFSTGATSEIDYCTVVITSSEVGLSTLIVDYLGEVVEEEQFFTFSPDEDPTKQWVDFDVDITPLEDVNLVANADNSVTHTFTVTVVKYDGAGEPDADGVEGAQPDIVLEGEGEILSNTCETGTDAEGECTVVIRSFEPGTSTVSATWTVTVDGVTRTFGDANQGEDPAFDTDDDPAVGVKDWVEYLISLDIDAINPIGTTHTFTVSMTVDTGDGPTAAAFEEVDLAVGAEDVGLIVAVNGEALDEPSATSSCVLDIGGECTVTIASNETGTTTLTASYDAVAGQSAYTISDEAVKTWVSNPAIDLVKTGSATLAEVGDVINYTYDVTNTGDVTLSNVVLTDVVDVNGTLTTIEIITTAMGISLEPGDTIQMTIQRTVTEDDLPGPIDNVATVNGTAPDGEVVEDVDDWSVDLVFTPGIQLVKTGSTTDAVIGDVVNYTYDVTNIGDVSLVDVTLVDEVTVNGVTTTIDIITEAMGISLEPGGSVQMTLQRPVTQADVPGPIDNVATATGTPPVGPDVSDTDDWSVTVTGSPGISVVKEADIEPGIEGVKVVVFSDDDPTTTADDSEVIVYTITITNTGDVTLTDVTLDDELVRSLFTDKNVSGPVSLPVTTLAPGQSVIVQTEHTVLREEGLQFEIVDNTATATGTAPDGSEVSASDDENVNVFAVLPLQVEREREPAPEVAAEKLPRTGSDTQLMLIVALMNLGFGLILLSGLPQALLGRREW